MPLVRFGCSRDLCCMSSPSYPHMFPVSISTVVIQHWPKCLKNVHFINLHNPFQVHNFHLADASAYSDFDFPPYTHALGPSFLLKDTCCDCSNIASQEISHEELLSWSSSLWEKLFFLSFPQFYGLGKY